MNVLHVVRNLDRYSGAAYQALNLAKYQCKSGIKASVLNISDSSECRSAEVGEVLVITIPRSKEINTLRKVFKQSSIVHFHGMFLFEIIFAKLCKCKVLLKSTLLGEDDFDSVRMRPFGLFRLAVLRMCVDFNNALVTPIKRINQAYLPHKKVTCIPNYVDMPHFDILPQKKNAVVFVGAIIKRKNVLESIEYFLNNFQSSGYVMYIVGPQDIIETEGDREYCKKFNEVISLHPNSIFYLGKIDQRAVSDLLVTSKALIFLSSKEGMPNVVLEALAANCFVITSSISGVAADIYEHGVEGFNIEKDDPFSLDEMEHAIKHKYPLSLVNRKFVFSLSTSVYTEIYQRMLDE